MSKEDIRALLREICEDAIEVSDDFDLVESEILDSYAIMELFSRLEDMGYDIQPTRIDRNKLKTISGIAGLLGVTQ
jgi:acyl carrier protein